MSIAERMTARPAVPRLAVDDWTPTRETLHLWLQIVGKVRMRNAPPVNHWWHAALQISSRGITTGAVPSTAGVFDIELDLLDHRLEVRLDDGRREAMPLEPMSVAAFYERLCGMLARLGIPADIHPAPNEVEHAIPFADDTLHDAYVPQHAWAFWRQLCDASTALHRFRSTLVGKASPVHFFWGAMDLAVTAFSGGPAPRHPGGVPNCPDSVMVESYSAELSSAGFWPGGGAEGAYYAYMYPEVDGYRDARVPDGARYDEALGEFLLPYELVRDADDPDALVAAFLGTTHDAARRLARWDG